MWIAIVNVVLRNLLAHPEVSEVSEFRGSFGLMAFHGGNLERTTDVIAATVAERTAASFYGVIQAPPLRRHVPSIHFDPAHSPKLTAFMNRVDTVVAVHGYGREDLFADVLLGGRNRALADHLAHYLKAGLPKQYGVINDLDEIPVGLRGLHPAKPVNLPVNAGVQLELPPTLRWNRDARNWSDHENTPRAPQVALLIDVLTEAIRKWEWSTGATTP